MKNKMELVNKKVPLINDWSPKSVFLTDALGALFTTTMLGVILVQFRSYLGISSTLLYMLAMFVFALFLYSSSIYFIKPSKWVAYLKIIAILNWSYCIITLFTIFQIENSITLFGKVYFIGEALLIALIALLEWLYSKSKEENNFEIRINQ